MSDDKIELPPESVKPNYGNRLTEGQRKEAMSRWALGDSKLGEMAADYGVTVNALSRLFKRHGVTKGESKDLHARLVKNAQAEVASTVAMDTVQEINKRKIFYSKSFSLLANEKMKLVAKIIRGDTSWALHMADFKAMETASKGLAVDRGETWLALDVINTIDEEQIPDLVWRELTDDDVEQLRDEQRQEAIASGEVPYDELELDDDGK